MMLTAPTWKALRGGWNKIATVSLRVEYSKIRTNVIGTDIGQRDDQSNHAQSFKYINHELHSNVTKPNKKYIRVLLYMAIYRNLKA